MTSRDPQRWCEAVRSAILATAWLLVLSAINVNIFRGQFLSVGLALVAPAGRRRRGANSSMALIARRVMTAALSSHRTAPSRNRQITQREYPRRPAGRRLCSISSSSVSLLRRTSQTRQFLQHDFRYSKAIHSTVPPKKHGTTVVWGEESRSHQSGLSVILCIPFSSSSVIITDNVCLKISRKEMLLKVHVSTLSSL